MNSFHSRDVVPFQQGDVVRCHWYPTDFRVYVVHSCVKSERAASGWEVKIEEKYEGSDSFLARNPICAGWYVLADGRAGGDRKEPVADSGGTGALGGGRPAFIPPALTRAAVIPQQQERENEARAGAPKKGHATRKSVGHTRRHQAQEAE